MKLKTTKNMGERLRASSKHGVYCEKHNHGITVVSEAEILVWKQNHLNIFGSNSGVEHW